MGFDKHFYEDHCYLDDPTNDVGMNVEIIEDGYHIVHDNITIEKPATRYPANLSGKDSNMSCGTTTKSESKKASTHVYLPYTEYCTEHTDMLLLEDEKLVKPGDKFNSHDDFVQYLNENAKRWYFYYKCYDSRKPNTENESYTYTCVYLKNKEKYKKKGLRKRNNNMKTECPCKIKIRHLPNEKELTVVYVCNHHDHELSLEEFCKLQHGRRLPPYVKQEIMDFLTLQVDKGKIKKYVEMETGFKMSHPFFYALEKNLQKSKYGERQLTEERINLLNQKIAAVEELYGNNIDENPELTESCDEQSASLRRTNSKRDPQAKRKSKTPKDLILTDSPKKTKVELCPEVNYSEVVQEEISKQETIKCEIQKNPWVSDQCVPVLPNSASLADAQGTHTETLLDPEGEMCAYRLEYYNPEDNTTQIINNDFAEVDDNTHDNEAEANENDIDDIAYETIVTDGNVDTQVETLDYVDQDTIINNDETVVHDDNSQENINDFSIEQYELQNTQGVIEVDHIEYLDENNEQLIGYIDEATETDLTNVNENGAHDVGIQTNRNMDTGQMLLPVFDVYMKDGNVTGFVINDNVMNGLKQGVETVDKGIQTSEDIIYSDIQEIENEDAEIILDTTDHDGDTYTKHEYVHKYNIDQYMSQPNFPKYVDILAKETYTDVLNMFKNVYNETAMFKLTTTQKGKEGNTRIRYITHNGRILKKKTDDSKREKLGKKLHSVFVLKEKMRMLKKQNDELIKRNNYLESVALNLVEMV